MKAILITKIGGGIWALLLTVPYTETGLRSMLRRVTLGDQMNGTSASGDRIKLMLFVTSGV